MSKTKQKKKPDKKKVGKKAKMPKSVSGVIRNGVVVLENGVAFAEGQRVNVQPADPVEELDPLYRIWEKAADTGIPDLAENLDHYLYGHPKVIENG